MTSVSPSWCKLWSGASRPQEGFNEDLGLPSAAGVRERNTVQKVLSMEVDLLSWSLLLVFEGRGAHEKGALSARHGLGKGLFYPSFMKLLYSIWTSTKHIHTHTNKKQHTTPNLKTLLKIFHMQTTSWAFSSGSNQLPPRFTKSRQPPLWKWLFILV